MTLIYFIIILGVTLTVHEFGHFLFAKKSGIYCYEFSIGMGPKLHEWHRKGDETVYVLRLLPIGGYVSMAGEDVEVDEDIPEDKRMQSKPWHQRFLTIVAGVMFNFILAIVLLFIITLISGAPTNRPIIDTIEKGYDVTDSGLKKGDLIVGLNGDKIVNADDFMLKLQVSAGEEITLKVKRGDKYHDVTFAPKKVKVDGQEGYKYGFSLSGKTTHGVLAAIQYAFEKTWSLLRQMALIIYYLATGQLSLSSLAGPIGIFTIIGESAKAGILNLVYLTAYISINVGFINLLPIPAFDGGRLFFLIVEKIKGSPVDAKFENTVHAIGFILLMILMVFITYNDIVRLFQ